MKNYLSKDYFDLTKQLLLKMKLTFFSLIISVSSLMAVNVHSQGEKVNISIKDQSIRNIISDIEKQTEYLFVYDKNEIDIERKLSLSANNQSVAEVLTDIFNNTNVVFAKVGTNIILIPGTNIHQQSRITGTVTDASTGEAIIGAYIIVEGTSFGVISDMNGNFSIEVPNANASLIFSFIGYNSETIALNGETNLQVKLIPDITKLEEVVVIGYGTRLRGELTGSVAKLKSDKIESRPVTGTLDALQGIVPGVNITRQNGQPGRQGYELKIRGTSSVNGNVPLILIDGVPGDIDLINPNDIESVTVLKDAAAAIYGARAADGVILITTKRGRKSDKPVISYSYNLAFKKPGILKKPATTGHLVKMFNEANFNDGDPQTFSNETLAKIAANDPGVGPGENWGVTSYPMFYQSKDWYGDLFKTSQLQTHNLSISGGTENSSYLVSAGYLNDNGTINAGKNSSDKYNIRMSLQSNLRKNLKMDVNISYDNLNIKEPSELSDAINNALKTFSYIPLRNPAGNYYTYQGYQNPFQELEVGGNRITKNSRLNNNLKLDWEPIKGLVWTGQAAVNIERYDDNTNYATFYGYNWDNSLNGLPRHLPNAANYYDYNTVYKNFSTYINYTKTIGNHYINLMAGASREKMDRNSKYIAGADFSSNEIFMLTLSDPKNLNAGDYWDNNSWALLSYFGRLNYSFAGKYYLDGTLRKDGSSKFSPDQRWSDIYPSISAAWKISEEAFFKSVIPNTVLDLFKVRASWGRTGNQDIGELGLFDYIQLINIGGQYPIDGSSISKLASMNGIASPMRTWETIETKNLGFDLGFFNSKLRTSFDIYQKENTNMLVRVSYPSTLGASAPSSNAGQLVTKGWELTGDWNSKIGAVDFSLGFILNYNTNTLTNLQGQDTYNLGLTGARQGYPINSYFGYKGSVIRTQSELEAYAAEFAGKGIVPATQANGYKGLGIGDVMYEDIDGDGQITTYGDKTKGFNGDAVFLGSQDPKYTYGVNAGLKYKNFDFGLILQGTGNKYTWRGNGNFGVPYSAPWFQPLDYFYGKTFSQDNIDAQYPRLSNSGTVKRNNYQCSSIYLENTRYLRLKNITIGYTISNLLIGKFNLQNARVYLSGQDIFEFAKGTWDKIYDPEENSAENNYPMFRTFSFGVSVNF